MGYQKELYTAFEMSETFKSLLSAESFEGATYDQGKDFHRLKGQLKLIWTLMRDTQWRTLYSISQETGIGEASVSAQLRNLRKIKWGGFKVNRRRVGNVFFYQVLS